MTVRLIGGAFILGATVYVLFAQRRRERRERETLWSLAGALGYMETAIRWEKLPLPRIFETLAARPACGIYFEKLVEMMQSDLPLHSAWENVFSKLRGEGGAIMRRVALSGDEAHLVRALRCAQEKLTALCRRRETEDRQRARVSGAAGLSAAGVLIILLL